MTLLSKPILVQELRLRLPGHCLLHSRGTADLEFWRLAVQVEALTNEESELDIDDAISVAMLAEIMCDSVLAELRGG